MFLPPFCVLSSLVLEITRKRLWFYPINLYCNIGRPFCNNNYGFHQVLYICVNVVFSKIFKRKCWCNPASRRANGDFLFCLGCMTLFNIISPLRDHIVFTIERFNYFFFYKCTCGCCLFPCVYNIVLYNLYLHFYKFFFLLDLLTFYLDNSKIYL